MAQEKDKVEKILEDYKDVFADICNTLIFKEPYIKEELLRHGETESMYKAEKGELANQYRDKVMHYGGETFTVASIGIENQSTIEKFMPLRIMGYDFASYQAQLTRKEPLSPVLTIVLNFSDTRWNKPKNLHGLMKVSRRLKPHVQDYHITVFDVAYLDDEVIEQFTSDFKVVAKFFKRRRLSPNGQMLDDDTEIKHVEAVMDLFRVFTGDSGYFEIYQNILKERKQKGETVNMDKVIAYYLNTGRTEGRLEGKSHAFFQMVQDGNITLQIAASNLDLSPEEVLKRMEESGYQVPTMA